MIQKNTPEEIADLKNRLVVIQDRLVYAMVSAIDNSSSTESAGSAEDAEAAKSVAETISIAVSSEATLASLRVQLLLQTFDTEGDDPESAESLKNALEMIDIIRNMVEKTEAALDEIEGG